MKIIADLSYNVKGNIEEFEIEMPFPLKVGDIICLGLNHPQFDNFPNIIKELITDGYMILLSIRKKRDCYYDYLHGECIQHIAFHEDDSCISKGILDKKITNNQ